MYTIMSIPSKIFNHTEIAHDNLLGQFKGKPVIQAVLKTWTDKIQEVENDLYDLMTKTLFLTAEGTNLERYGQLFGIAFPEGLTDSEYRELLISEIMRRSSDGTPNRIRQILEATTGISGTRIFEHMNANQKPYRMGCILVYGYVDANVLFNVSIETKEARYLRWASPITTGSCVLGLHRFGESTLFIPSELNQNPLTKLGLSSNKTINPSFDFDLKGWEYDENFVSYQITFEDPNPTPHNDGVLKMESKGEAVSSEISQKITGLDSTAQYTLSVFHKTNKTNITSTLQVTDKSGSTVIATTDITGTGRALLQFEGQEDVTITLIANTTLDTSASILLDLFELINSEIGEDQDELVDSVDNWIGVRKDVASTYGVGFKNGILPEFENQIHRFQVESSIPPTEYPSEDDRVLPIGDNKYGIDDFSVDTSLGIEDMNVEYRDLIRPSNTCGLMLEISQINLDKE